MGGDVGYSLQQNIQNASIQVNIRSDQAQNSTNSAYDAYIERAQAAKNAAAKPLSGSGLDIGRFTQYLSNITRTTSTQKCAKSIRVALQNSGAKIQQHPVAASDWGNTLKKIGFNKINPQFDNPKKGDIYIIKATGKHTYGHIAGYSGSDWVSDFKQRTHDVYRNQKVTYEYYRLAQ